MNPSVSVVFRILTVGDKALIGLLTLFSLMSLGLFYQGRSPGQAVIVSIAGKETLRKELSENRSFDVRGQLDAVTRIEPSSIANVMEPVAPCTLKLLFSLNSFRKVSCPSTETITACPGRLP